MANSLIVILSTLILLSGLKLLARPWSIISCFLRVQDKMEGYCLVQATLPLCGFDSHLVALMFYIIRTRFSATHLSL